MLNASVTSTYMSQRAALVSNHDLLCEMSNRRFIILDLDPSPQQCVGGIMVSIAAFQAVDPGSIPGRRSPFFSFLYLPIFLKIKMESI